MQAKKSTGKMLTMLFVLLIFCGVKTSILCFVRGQQQVRGRTLYIGEVGVGERHAVWAADAGVVQNDWITRF